MLKIFLSTIMLFPAQQQRIGPNRLSNATSLTEIAANVQSEKLIILLTARCQKLLKYLS